MALKDLVADHRKIAEETIEKIVKPFVRYDAAAHKIIWTPEARSLRNDARLLVFLVAVLGWQYVVDEDWEAHTKPADLERELGMVGGTLRPILKRLKDAHLLAEVNGHYRVQLANLDSVEAAIGGETPRVARKPRPRVPPKARSGNADNSGAEEEPEADSEAEASGAKRTRKTSGKPSNIAATLGRLIDAGYFDEPRTAADVQKRFRREAVMVKGSSLPWYFIDAVRKGRLTRDEMDAGGKSVWAYTTSKKGAG